MTFLAPQLGSIVDQSGRTTPAELRAAITSRKRELAAAGCREGSVVALILPNEAGFFVNLFAVWELGGCAVPISPAAPDDELGRVLRLAGASIVCRGPNTTALDGGNALPGTALLLYTSGSTGVPKGVMLSYAAVLSKLETLAGVQPAALLARTLCLLPVSFGHGLLGNSLPTLLAAGELFLQPAFSGSVAAKLGEFVDANAITFFSSVPAVWSTVLAFASPPAGGSLKRVFCASAGLPVETWREAKGWLGAGVDFRNVYGITEAASWLSALPEGVAYEESGAVGKGWSCDFRVGDGGEVLARAPYLMTGYLGDPAATSACLHDGWLRTGDTGSLDPVKGLRVLGRLKDQINRGGLKVSPVEVEECLMRHEAVRECCVFGVADPVAGETVAAAVVAKGATPAAAELRAHCRQYLSEFKIPEKVHFLPALPRNSRGKVSRLEVAAACGSGSS